MCAVQVTLVGTNAANAPTGRRTARRTADRPLRRPRPSCWTTPAESRSTGLLPAPALLAPELVFDVAAVAVMPVYAAMVFAPKSRLARAATADTVFLLGSALYAVLMVAYGGMEFLRPFLDVKSANVGLTMLAGLMQNGKACSIAWLHLLLIDLFQARWVYRDCVARSIPAALRAASLGLCFMVAPVGLFFHVASSALYSTFRLKNRTI